MPPEQGRKTCLFTIKNAKVVNSHSSHQAAVQSSKASYGRVQRRQSLWRQHGSHLLFRNCAFQQPGLAVRRGREVAVFTQIIIVRRAHFNAELMLFRARYRNEEDEWDTYLGMMEFAINNAQHFSTGYTPFYLNYSHHPIGPEAPVCLELQGALYETMENLWIAQLQ